MRAMNVGLVGFGTVGSGVVQLLSQRADLLARRLGANLVLKRVADQDLVCTSRPGRRTSWMTRKSMSWWN
jgi:homoserine dehydrogenase